MNLISKQVLAISNLQESERKKHSKELAVTIPEKVFRDIVANLAIVREFGEEDARSTLEGVHLYSKSERTSSVFTRFKKV